TRLFRTPIIARLTAPVASSCIDHLQYTARLLRDRRGCGAERKHQYTGCLQPSQISLHRTYFLRFACVLPDASDGRRRTTPYNAANRRTIAGGPPFRRDRAICRARCHPCATRADRGFEMAHHEAATTPASKN